MQLITKATELGIYDAKIISSTLNIPEGTHYNTLEGNQRNPLKHLQNHNTPHTGIRRHHIRHKQVTH